jgi:acetyl esterase
MLAAARPTDSRRYIPNDDALSAQLPVIVFFHGGGWVQGDVDTHDAPCAALGQRRCAASFYPSS